MKKGMLIALLCAVVWFCSAGASPPASDGGRGQAAAALGEADAAVNTAAARRALWTTASDALREARVAFERGDFAAAERLARYATEQAQLGIKQLDYRHFSLPKDSK